MPLRGEGHSSLVRDEAPYFESLDQLDTWFTQSHDKLSGVLPYQPRPYIHGQSDSKGKLLVCHDYRGGYTESPSGLCYTFNFWSLCDIFVYFSHNRVTVPPSGWTNTAHKQGTKILGTLIFEGALAEPDCLQLIAGRAGYAVEDNKIPISRRYAVFLAELAYQRGFDGYLLNFESVLPHGTNHARALAEWMLLLRAELRIKVGPHAQVMWYDSVIYNGLISHQNRLNGLNLPFFLASDTFFTNYWWSPETQDSMIRYLTNLNRSVLGPMGDTTSIAATRTLQSIYSGVDVWPGRGQYGDSGFCCYRALTHTSSRGISAALFAPGWTWEEVTKDAANNWDEWWDNERKLWLGPIRPGEIITVPDSPEGPFKPVIAFFQNLSLPDPSNFVFYTNFSPGVGYSWFVEGKNVLETKDGWTDVDKQGSIGDLVWPRPTPCWQGVQHEEAAITASTTLDMTTGYNGGNTLKLTLTCAGHKSEDTVKSIWLPIQSLTVTTQELFEARIVYKVTVGNDVDFNSRVHIKSLSKEENDTTGLTASQAVSADLPRGWVQQTIDFTSTSTWGTVSIAIGFVVNVKPNDSSTEATFSFSLGQLAVYPAQPPQPVSVGMPSITRAKFAPALDAANTPQGILTWDTASTFSPIDDVQVDDEESTTPVWLLQDTPAYRFPTFIYFNIYALSLDHSAYMDPTSAVFVGTTGLDGRANRFYVERTCFPAGWDERVGIRFYVQGVTDRGEVLPWERCATVDHGTSAA